MMKTNSAALRFEAATIDFVVSFLTHSAGNIDGGPIAQQYLFFVAPLCLHSGKSQISNKKKRNRKGILTHYSIAGQA